MKMKTFGERLKELRQEKGLTQRSMAAIVDKTERHYQAMEKGEINVPGLTLIKLADFFDVTLDYLVGRSEDR